MQRAPWQGQLSLCSGKQQVSLSWGTGGMRVQRLWQPLTNPPTLPWLEREKWRGIPGGMGQKQKSRDRIYSYEHMTLLLIVLLPWEESFFSWRITLQCKQEKNLATSYLVPPAPSIGPKVGADST